jgi:hypothetical protein
VQTTIEHEIIDVTTSGGFIDVQPTVICTDNIPCQIHRSKLSFMFCQTCDVLVRSNCICSSHKKHDLESIDQVCMEKMEKLKAIRDKISQNLVRRESENKDLDKDDYTIGAHQNVTSLAQHKTQFTSVNLAWNIVRADNCWLNVYEASRCRDTNNFMYNC